MPDLDTSLQELRDDLRGTLTRPDLSKVAGRARQQIVRRRMQLGAIVAVVLVSAAVPVMRMVPSESNPPARPPDPPPYTVDFGDAAHGYAFQQDCAAMNGPCVFSLRATTDSGRTWRPVDLPEGDEQYGRGGLVVLGPDEVWFSRAEPGPRSTPEGFVSDDGGRTWRGSTIQLQESPVVISSGDLVTPICVSGSADKPCVVGIGVRASGGLSPVLTQPPLLNPVPARTATESGLYWAAGRAQATGNWAVAVTSDSGRTWTTSELDLRGLPAQTVDSAWSVTERGRDMYLTVVGNVGVGPLELLAVFHSTNKGVSWTRTWQSTNEHELQAVAGNAVATADGQLLVHSAVVGTMTSRDDGRTFTKASHQLPGPVTWTRAGYLAVGPNNMFELSQNGVTWQRFEVR